MFNGRSSSELACNSSTSATGTEFQKAMESSVNSAIFQTGNPLFLTLMP